MYILPSGWIEIELGEISKLLRGISYQKKDAHTTAEDFCFPILRANNISDSCINFDCLIYVPKGYIADEQFVKKGDIIICMSSGSKSLVGKSAIAKTDLPYSFGAFNGLLRINKNINSQFIAYSMQQSDYRKHIEALTKGTNINNLKQDHIFTFPIPLPPLPEQHRIAAKIDSLFSELDNGVDSLQMIKVQLETYKQAVLKWAFEGKLTNITIREKRKLEDLCFFITKGTTPDKKDMSPGKGDIPFIKVYNLTFNGALDFTINPTYVTKEAHNNIFARSKITSGDVLMNIVGPPLGKVSVVPVFFKDANINQAIVRFRCNEYLDNRYLMNFLLSKKTIEEISRKAKATAGQVNLTLEICRAIEIPYCSKEEQLAIVSAIESRFALCDQLEKTIDDSLAKSAALRQSILKRAFEGRLVPQDPNDEPAEKLLERIRAEKLAVQAGRKHIRRREKA